MHPATGRVPLLHDVSELMGKQALPARPIGLKFAWGEKNAIAGGEGTRPNLVGEIPRDAVGVDPYGAKVMAEPRLHEPPSVGRQGPSTTAAGTVERGREAGRCRRASCCSRHRAADRLELGGNGLIFFISDIEGGRDLLDRFAASEGIPLDLAARDMLSDSRERQIG